MKVVISLGGSVIVPDEIDVGFLTKFKELIKGFLGQGHRFVIICGGGSTCRKYQDAARRLGIFEDNLDWIGISATKLNAELMRSLFGLKTFESDPEKAKLGDLTIMSGWKPGWSTDYDVVVVANRIKADLVINITDVKYIYDKDPGKFKDAKPLKKLSWARMKEISGTKWRPGLNVPFDPIAVRHAEGLKVAFVNKDLDNLKNLLLGKKFDGTVVS
jgi:uridylate kinase